MPQSTGRDLHVDALLSNVAINFRPAGMIADQIAPIVTVAKETDLYPVFSRNEAFSLELTRRSRGTEARRVTRTVSSAGYSVKNYALAYDTPIEDRANIDAAISFELEAGAARYLQDKLMLDWDNRVLSQVASATNVSTGFVPASSWATGGDPVSQIYQMKEQMRSVTGQDANSILIGWRAWNLLRRNTAMRNFINGTNNGGGVVTRQQIQEAFEIERLLVAGVMLNTANEAQPGTLTNNPLHDSMLLYYAPTAPSRETPSFMYSFRWTNPLLGAPMAVIRHPFDSRAGVEGIEVRYYQDEKITGSDYGALLRGVGSSQSNGIA